MVSSSGSALAELERAFREEQEHFIELERSLRTLPSVEVEAETSPAPKPRRGRPSSAKASNPLQQNNSKNLHRELILNQMTLIQSRMTLLQSDIIASRQLLQMPATNGCSDSWTIPFSIFWVIFYFIVYNLPETAVCQSLGLRTKCSMGILNDGTRPYFDCFYWLALSTQFALLQQVLCALNNFVFKSNQVNADKSKQD